MECVIDALKICYKANKERLEPLMDVEAGGRYDIQVFYSESSTTGSATALMWSEERKR